MKRVFALLLLGIVVLSVQAQATKTLTVITHDSFSLSEELLQAFEREHSVTVAILRTGDTGRLVNQAVLTKNNPLGDVLFGIDNTFLSRALDAEIFIPYESPELAFVDKAFVLDAEYRVTPIDYGDVCLNYDIAYFEANKLALPETLQDLTLPRYRGLLVAMNPATSSPGLAFMLATVGVFGEEGDNTYLDFWRDLLANDVLIVEDWETAYFGNFSAVGGEYSMVVSYASSPPFTVDEETGLATTASITAAGMCFRQIEFAGILSGTENEALAQAFIDFLLSEATQAEVPSQMYVFPVREGVVLPEDFGKFATIAEEPAQVAYALIEANRDKWIQAWLEAIAR